MRLEDVAPRTLVLGGLAGWALVAWVLALAGMGARLPAPEAGVAPVASLPPVSAAPSPALGPPAQYAATSERPLFAPDRRPHAFVLQPANGAPVEAPDFDLVLTSVLITPQASIAIVQKPDGSAAWRVRAGDAPEAYPAWRLVLIEPRSATFVGPDGEKTLPLRVFDGQGGPATAVAPPPPPVETAGPVASPADATPDAAQIDAIRRRIEARRAERARAQQAHPSAATASPPPAPTSKTH